MGDQLLIEDPVIPRPKATRTGVVTHEHTLVRFGTEGIFNFLFRRDLPIVGDFLIYLFSYLRITGSTLYIMIFKQTQFSDDENLDEWVTF